MIFINKNIAIIDADIIDDKKHRFPNLCCMKLSAYHKDAGDIVTLKTDYLNLEVFDKVYISKVFTDTVIPCEPEDKTNKTCENIENWYSTNEFLKSKNIEYGGTGFYYDKAPPLPYEIEHIKPDYHLYDEWVKSKISSGKKRKEFTYYLDYSIGFLTRKCFRKCSFCVNRNSTHSVVASNFYEFYDESRPKICFLDDNFFSHPDWKKLILPVIQSGKKFQFKQGLDERLLNKDKIKEMSKWKYDGDYIFAFDNIADKEVIISRLKLIIEEAPNIRNRLKFYVFCGYDRNNIYDEKFWHNDIQDLFERIYILSKYGAKPYIMRYEKVYKSNYSSFYASIAAWCNQPAIFKTFTFRLYCQCRYMRRNGYKLYGRNVQEYLKKIGLKGVGWTEMERIENLLPNVAEKYYDFYG